jgi:hypothetical protein
MYVKNHTKLQLNEVRRSSSLRSQETQKFWSESFRDSNLEASIVWIPNEQNEQNEKGKHIRKLNNPQQQQQQQIIKIPLVEEFFSAIMSSYDFFLQILILSIRKANPAITRTQSYGFELQRRRCCNFFTAPRVA